MYEIGVRQAKMEADNLRMDLTHRLTHFSIERKPKLAFRHTFDVKAHALVMQLQEALPSLLRCHAGHFHRMAEEIEIERTAHLMANCLSGLAHAIWSEQG